MSDAIFVDLVNQPIDLALLQVLIDDPDVGAQGWFVGVTRRTTVTVLPGREDNALITQSLSYQSHETMARRELLKLAVAARERFGLTKIVLVHRLGEVSIGQASVVVGCSSPHRPAVLAALPWIMDRLKKDVPIWKREQYADQSSEWVHPMEPVDHHDST